MFIITFVVTVKRQGINCPGGVPSKTKILTYFEKRRKTKYELQTFDHSGQVS